MPDRLVRDVLARSEGNAYFAEELLAAGAGAPTARCRPRWPTCCWPGWSGCRRRCSGWPGSPRSPAAGSATRCCRRRPGCRGGAGGGAARGGHPPRARRRGRDRYAFRHALLQEAVYGDLLPGERVRLHGTYARLFADGVGEQRGRAGLPLAGEPRPAPAPCRASVQAADRGDGSCTRRSRPCASWSGRCSCGTRCPTPSGAGAAATWSPLQRTAAQAAASAGELQPGGRAGRRGHATWPTGKRRAAARAAAAARQCWRCSCSAPTGPRTPTRRPARRWSCCRPSRRRWAGCGRRRPGPGPRSTSTATRRGRAGPRRRWPAPARSGSPTPRPTR